MTNAEAAAFYASLPPDEAAPTSRDLRAHPEGYRLTLGRIEIALPALSPPNDHPGFFYLGAAATILVDGARLNLGGAVTGVDIRIRPLRPITMTVHSEIGPDGLAEVKSA